MLTRMTDDDWTFVLEVFRAVLPRRGGKGQDDRRFLTALHCFTVHSITWRALPAEFGNWNSVWKRFSRLSQSGVFEAFFLALAECSRTAGLIQMFDSTSIRGHVSAAGAKGRQRNQALGRSRGGFGTKIHVKCDYDGMPLDFHLTGNEASDTKPFETLIEIGPEVTASGYRRRQGLRRQSQPRHGRKRGIVPVIPYRKNAKVAHKKMPKTLYARRARVEPSIGKMKRFKRIALRCEKTTRNFASFVALACEFIWIKSVHTA